MIKKWGQLWLFDSPNLPASPHIDPRNLRGEGVALGELPHGFVLPCQRGALTKVGNILLMPQLG
jgi:hypothetical protein